jgi:phosphoribosylformimino-5-aminoimidazole carboxamide ribotide isomerase
MIIIPAIDLKDGKCVRLRQGAMDDSTIFNDNPSEQAKLWQDLGAKRIHVVDLNGSVHGRPVNLEAIRAIVGSVSVPVQLGGGIRDDAGIRMYLDIGISNVILGTIAARSPELVLQYLEEFPDKLAIGIDARGGLVAVQGWTESTGTKAGDLAAKFDPRGPFAFIYTDIERDGMMRGPNIKATRELARGLKTPVILSGGVSSMDDLRDIMPLKDEGISGIIIGRALYEKTIDLKEAIDLVE